MRVEIIEGSAPSNSVNTHDDDNVIYVEYERSRVYDELCKYLLSSRDKHCFMGNRSNILYWQTIISFDIETTNTYVDNNKVSFMYIWQVAFQDIVIVGRTWEQFLDLCDLFKYTFGLDENHRMIIWVHNLAHEFQFIRKLFKWEQVFASEERKVIYCRNDMGIEFRCTYMLSGMSLQQISSDMAKANLTKFAKMVGDLDYSKIRNSKTKLSDEELQYCYNDVIVMNVYLTNYMNDYDTLQDIPYTKTGVVRNFVRSNTIYSENELVKFKYKDLMDELVITPEEYKICKAAFAGGFTHASDLKVGDMFEEVSSVDISSSYPAVMLTEKFPMSRGNYIEYPNEKQLEYLLSNKLCIFMCKLNGVRPRVDFEHIISRDKCIKVKKAVVDNGRIVEAESIIIAITNVDLEMYTEFYDFDNVQIVSLYYYEPGYLPRDLLLSIGQLYIDKTKLKGVDGEETHYVLKKQMLNSCYGMIVTDPLRDNVEYLSEDNQWHLKPASLEEEIDKYNNSKTRFLFYPWGIFVTAYARKRLWEMILRTGEDHLYSDTDSDKFLNMEKHLSDIEQLNSEFAEKIEESCKANTLPREMFYAKDVKGKEHPLGYWDLETGDKPYKKFKTLGAKRYLYETDPDKKGNYLHLTFAGWNKEKGGKYLQTKEDPFGFFALPMDIPIEYTGKLTHTYIDDAMEFDITDYQGNVDHVIAPSGLHLEAQEFKPGVPMEYERYLKRILGKSLRKQKD